MSSEAPSTVTASAFLSGVPLTARAGSTIRATLLVNSGTSNFVTGAQSYLTFTNSILQVADYTASGCVVTNTLTAEPAYFEAQLQNDVCNSSSPCNLGRLTAPPSSIGFASGWL